MLAGLGRAARAVLKSRVHVSVGPGCLPASRGRDRKAPRATGRRGRAAGETGTMFFFFSNRLGCVGSLALSAVVTVLLLVLGVLHR